MAKKTTKKSSSLFPSGYSKSGLEQIINDEEYKRMGTADYPWRKTKKGRMLRQAKKLATHGEIIFMIGETA